LDPVLWKIFIYSFNSEFEDEKGVTISHKSKYRKYNDQKKTSQQNTTQRTTDRQVKLKVLSENCYLGYHSCKRKSAHNTGHDDSILWMCKHVVVKVFKKKKQSNIRNLKKIDWLEGGNLKLKLYLIQKKEKGLDSKARQFLSTFIFCSI
jgi:hypothetical protein